MSKYLENGWLVFPPVIVGGGSGDYVTKCPLDACEEAEIQIVTIAAEGSSNPAILVSGDQLTPGTNLDYSGATSLGARNTGTDQGTIYVQGIALAGSSMQDLKVGNNIFIPLADSQHRCFIRIDCAAGKAVFLTMQYRVRPIGTVVADVQTVHHDNEREHNVARAEQAHQRLAAKTIQKRGESIDI